MSGAEQACSYCGKIGIYAKGFCRSCYARNRRNGTPEKIDRHGRRPWQYSELTKQILEMHKKRIRQIDIARSLGVSRQNVCRVIKDFSVPTNADDVRSMNDENIEAWYWWMHDEMMNYTDSYVFVHDWLRKKASKY